MRTIATLLIGFGTATAQAHTADGAGNEFISDFVHPLFGADHLLAMAAVGIWRATLGRPLVYALRIAFPLLMVVGGLLGIAAQLDKADVRSLLGLMASVFLLSLGGLVAHHELLRFPKLLPVLPVAMRVVGSWAAALGLLLLVLLKSLLFAPNITRVNKLFHPLVDHNTYCVATLGQGVQHAGFGV